MSLGLIRRKHIISWIHTQEAMRGLPVNNKYQFNIEKDKDLQILLKKGVLKRLRVHSGYKNAYRRSGKHQTYLVIA